MVKPSGQAHSNSDLKGLMQHHRVLTAFHWRISPDTEITWISEKKSAWNFINAKVLNTIITVIAPKWEAEEPGISGFWSRDPSHLQ